MSHNSCQGHGCSCGSQSSHHSQCCSCKGCSCPCHQHHSCEDHHPKHEDFTEQLLHIADQAWMEVLTDKIKKHVEAMSGDHLDQLAKLVAESNKAIWKDKMATDKSESQYLDKISEFLNK